MSLPTFERPMVTPRLWRSQRNAILAGVCGGLSEKFSIDSTLMRVLYAGFTLMSGIVPGFALYVILWAITRRHDPRLFPQEHDY